MSATWGGGVEKETWQGRRLPSEGMNVTAGVVCSGGKGSAPEQRGPGEKGCMGMQGQQAEGHLLGLGVNQDEGWC